MQSLALALVEIQGKGLTQFDQTAFADSVLLSGFLLQFSIIFFFAPL